MLIGMECFDPSRLKLSIHMREIITGRTTHDGGIIYLLGPFDADAGIEHTAPAVVQLAKFNYTADVLGGLAAGEFSAVA